MYWYYKLALAFILALVIGFVGYGLREHIPGINAIGKDAPEVAQGHTMPMPAPGPIGAMSINRPSTSTQGATTTHTSTPVMAEPAYVSVAHEQMALARKQLDKNEPIHARKILENALRTPEITKYSEIWIEVADLLSEVNTHIIMTDVPAPERITYTVVGGDSVWKIAKDLKVTMPMIMKGNQIDNTDPKIFKGQTLKIYQADWSIVVSKTHYLLELYDGERLTKIYHIGIGKQDRTPVGTFKVVTKERNPTWTYRGKQYEFGHPDNVLGTRWMGLEPVGTTSALLEGYGIHGTKEPDSIGKAMSNGCVRMVNEQVEELFDIVPFYTPVEIQE